jgi:hypothetical protein
MIFVSLRVTCSNNGTIPVYHSTESEISVVLIGDSVAQSFVVEVAITACPSAEPEISVGFIGVSVAQSFVVYVAITAYPSVEAENAVGFIAVSVAQYLVVGRASSFSYINT